MTATTDRLDTAAEVNGIPQVRHLNTAVPGPVSQSLQMRKLAAVANGIGTTLPVFIERAGGGIVLDVDGNSLIDLGSGIAVTTVGNANPEVAAAVQKQAAAFTHTCFTVTPYLGYVEVCEELNRLTPGTHEKRSALFNSGAEAVENAIKVARSFTRRNAVVVLEHAYHGRTNLTMGMTAKNMPYKNSFGPFAPEIYRVPMSYPYRDGGATGAEIAEIATTRIEKEIGADNVAALIIEPIQGEGGFIVPAPGYVAAMAAFAQKNGIVFVADEIQSGFCRTGQWFAMEHEGVIPDLVTTAKGIAGGMPLSGVTGRADIMDAAHAGGLGGTYSGSPVSCAAALAAMRWMTDNDANGKAKAIETIMYERLGAMKERFPAIGDLRGRGAMIAIELVKPGTLQPDSDRTNALAKHCHTNGVLVLTAGTYGNVLRFLPPLTMPAHLLNEALSIIEQGLEH
ncbi:MAG: 4-aminobutyrate--2-oxoglutarate transaminase [Actinomycetes bacterium]|jgi:4-aminobutyrate aminotransferase/(S)-3-amino-2-methylpropionate transaminase